MEFWTWELTVCTYSTCISIRISTRATRAVHYSSSEMLFYNYMYMYLLCNTAYNAFKIVITWMQYASTYMYLCTKCIYMYNYVHVSWFNQSKVPFKLNEAYKILLIVNWYNINKLCTISFCLVSRSLKWQLLLNSKGIFESQL